MKQPETHLAALLIQHLRARQLADESNAVVHYHAASWRFTKFVSRRTVGRQSCIQWR